MCLLSVCCVWCCVCVYVLCAGVCERVRTRTLPVQLCPPQKKKKKSHSSESSSTTCSLTTFLSGHINVTEEAVQYQQYKLTTHSPGHVGVELDVPGRVERSADVQPFAVQRQLNHLRSPLHPLPVLQLDRRRLGLQQSASVGKRSKTHNKRFYRTLFNWTRQDKMHEFSRKSCFFVFSFPEATYNTKINKQSI